MSEVATGGKVDLGALVRSKEYRRLLVVAAFIGVLVMLLTSSAGPAIAPIIIVAVVVAYITVESVSPRVRDQAGGGGRDQAPVR